MHRVIQLCGKCLKETKPDIDADLLAYTYPCVVNIINFLIDRFFYSQDIAVRGGRCVDRDVPEHVGVLSTAAIPNKHLDSYLITIEHKDYIGLDPRSLLTGYCQSAGLMSAANEERALRNIDKEKQLRSSAMSYEHTPVGSTHQVQLAPSIIVIYEENFDLGEDNISTDYISHCHTD
ncbi:hypothetical protein F2P81_011812 [Scophthalmus maximus]|uniref:Uncharacterized protein n=1 Tax=Scophthalmus maximus TaxID=52904 RepID=A0A6A4SX79_SCOMX|nr:hypothetical protein F2P81_011812 [Scophthalmus maximus]